MKRLLLILVFLIALFSLGGCETLDRWRAAIFNKTSEITSDVTNKVDEVGGRIRKTKESVQRKIDDVQNAVKEVQEAVDAVKKVTGDVGTSANAVVGTSISP